jgi:16S rRNA processing protein RimM
MASDWLPFGLLGRPHGTKGEILLHPYNDAATGSTVLQTRVRLTVGEEVRELQATAARQVQKGYLVCFEGIMDRDAAALLVGLEVEVPRHCLTPLYANEFYVEDIVGCEVVDVSGRSCGQVRGTYWNGAQDVMVVLSADGSERLLPVVAEHVLHFDRERGRLTVDFHE